MYNKSHLPTKYILYTSLSNTIMYKNDGTYLAVSFPLFGANGTHPIILHGSTQSVPFIPAHLTELFECYT